MSVTLEHHGGSAEHGHDEGERGSELRDADCDAALRAFALYLSPTARAPVVEIAP